MIEKSSTVDVFVPMDRRQALARGEMLPGRSNGAVLLADVSGFTPLTAALNKKFGPERGAEELTKQLNQVFEVLIARVHYYGGSVIIFSGDAITCWFEGDNGRRATACGLEMQAEMKQFVNTTAAAETVYSLALKVAVTAGRTSRFLVGHTHIQRLEALAGATLDRVAAAEQLLNQGETIVGAEVMAWFGDQLQVAAWRSDGRGEYFAVVDRMTASIPSVPWPAVSLNPQVGREWVMPPVAERVLRGEGDYLAQLRSSVALFLRFSGIDYDEDREAGAKLDNFIRWVQTVLARYEGYLLELTIGDKGSYLYCAFGTPLTHENDPARAVSAAIDLQSPPANLTYIGPVQIGISQGMMRAGAYGSSNRRSYGIQGQEVTIAARLMSRAKPGQTLVTGRILKTTDDLFEFDSLGPITLKGVQEPLPVYRVLGEKVKKFVLEGDKSGISPLVGRETETAVFQAQLRELKKGRGGTIVVEGDAGIGKSRLVAEFLLKAKRRGIQTLVGAGSEVTQSVAYHACRSIFQQLFGLKAEDDPEDGWDRVTKWLGLDADDELKQRMPLLSVVLPFHIPDSELTFQMRGELRANNTYDLLVMVLKKATEKSPLILVMEDGHWLDSASWSLIERLKWESLPLLLVIVTRPFGGLAAKEEISAQYERLLAVPDTRLILVNPLSLEQTTRLVCQRLGITSLPESVGELIHARAEGHPFFSEELAVALRDTGLIQIKNGYCQLTTGLDELYNLGFPNTIQKVITSRIDRLTAAQQLTLKVSSVVGRVFRYQAVYDVYPVDADRPELDSYLERLERLAIVRPQAPDGGSLDETASRNGGRSYIFSNAITHDIAYNLLLFEQRRQLHKAVGEWYEQQFEANLSNHPAILAHHWEKSESPVRAIPYLAKAGQQALKNGAYREGVSFLSRLVEIVENHPNEWPVVDRQFSQELQLAIWHRQLSEGYSSLGEMMKSINHARVTLTLLGNPEPVERLGMQLSFIKGTVVQIAHRIWPVRFLGKRQNELVFLEIGRAFLLLQEAYFFADDLLGAFHAGIQSLNYLEIAGVGTSELVRALSNFMIGMSALPRNLLVSRYERLAREALAETDSLEAQGLFLFRLGMFYYGTGFWKGGEAMHREAIDMYRHLGHTRLVVECLTNLGNFLFYEGRFAQLGALGQEDYRLANRQGSIQEMVWGLNLMGMERLMTAEDPGPALSYFEQAAEQGWDQMSGVTKVLYLGWLAMLHLKVGENEKAQKAADEIVEKLGKSPVSWALKLQAYTSPALVYLTLWERRGDDVEKAVIKAARAACGSMTRYAAVFPIGRPRSALYWGLNHWLSGRKSLARYYWRKSLSRAVALQMPYEEALAHLELGRHLAAENEERAEHLQAAEKIFERLQAGYDLLKCRELMEKKAG